MPEKKPDNIRPDTTRPDTKKNRLQWMPALAAAALLLLPMDAHAIQLHASSEGIITHQVGHLFFLFSMVILIFMVSGKGLDNLKGWRFIQYSAFFFILWNLDAVLAHFLDNQIHVVKLENISLSQVKIVTHNDSAVLAWVYYVLKLDHLLCVPAMFFLYKGLSHLLENQREIAREKDIP